MYIKQLNGTYNCLVTGWPPVLQSPTASTAGISATHVEECLDLTAYSAQS